MNYDLMRSAVGGVQKILDKIRYLYSQRTFERIAGTLTLLASPATAVSIVVGGAVIVIGAIKTDSLSIALTVGPWILAVSLLYYLATRFVELCEGANRRSPLRMGSPVYLDAVGLASALASLILLGVGILAAIEDSSIETLLIGVASAAMFGLLSMMMLNPSVLAIEISEDSSPGEDALAISALLAKALLRLVPVVFGTGTVLAALGFIALLFEVLDGSAYGLGGMFLAGGDGLAASFILLFGALLYPLVAYLVFVFTYLFIDVLGALIGLRGAAAGSAATRSYSSLEPSSHGRNSMDEPFA